MYLKDNRVVIFFSSERLYLLCDSYHFLSSIFNYVIVTAWFITQ